MALLVAQTRVESGVHSTVEVAYGGLLGALVTLAVFQVAPMSEELVVKAEAVAEKAYAPYSNYHVGAVVRTTDGREFEGVNVENAAYPLGVCAEKSALVAAVAAGYGPGRSPRSGSTPRPAAAAASGCTSSGSRRSASGATTARSRRTAADELLPDTWDLPDA